MAKAAARAKTAAALVYLNVAGALAGIVMGCKQVIVIERAAAGVLSEQEGNAHDRLYAGVGIVQLVLVLITGFLWLRWLHRAYSNLGAVGHRTSRFTPGWAVGYWFVPIVNLWRPYHVHRDLAARSRAGNALTEDEVRAAKTPLVDRWWTTWIVGGLLGNVSSRLAVKAQTLPQLRTVTWLQLAQDALIVLAALLALRLLRGVSTAQQRWLPREAPPLGLPVEVAAAPAPSLARLAAGTALPLSTSSARRLLRRIAAALVALAVAGAVVWWARLPPSADAIQAAAGASTVSLRCAGAGDVVGSGFFITPTRLVTDAYSLCADQTVEIVLADGRRLPGRAVEVDWRIGLALVSAPDAQAEPLELGDATGVRRGGAVYVFGQPDSAAGALARTLIGDEAFPFRGIPYLQFHSRIDPQHAGGPLLDERGQVIGIVTTRKGDGMGRSHLALPVNSLVTRHDGWALQTAPRMDDQIWARRLARAEEGDRTEAFTYVAKMAVSLPIVKSAIVRDRNILDVLVVRRGQERPPDSTARIDLVIGYEGLTMCRTSAAGRWQPIGEIGLPFWDPSISAWLASHELDSQLWGALYRVRPGEGCPAAYKMSMVPIYPAGRAQHGVRIQLESER